MTELRKNLLGSCLKRPSLSFSKQKPEFTPIKWTKYFDSEEKIKTKEGIFHCYAKGDSGPILLCLHGGGYNSLTWSLFADEITGLINCQVKALDLRGHGSTTTVDDNDLSLETLAKDVIEIAENLSKTNKGEAVILVGHSMGGAVAVEAAKDIKQAKGLCVIDVVEGSAMDALSSMQSILRGRPSYFKSLPHAIQWCYKGGQTHNLEAARVSMPGQIVNLKTGHLASSECDNPESHMSCETQTSDQELTASAFSLEKVTEEVEELDKNDSGNGYDCGKPPLPKSLKTVLFKVPAQVKDDEVPKYTWRIDLSRTERFWTGWFVGLSQKFLGIHIPKLLLLANIQGLDTALTVGQMQGKFQMQVMAKSGHAIHEDQPQNVAEILSGYLVKQKIATPKEGFVHPSMPIC